MVDCKFENVVALFNSSELPVFNEVQICPKGDFSYIYEDIVGEGIKNEDWRVDGHRWQQYAKKPYGEVKDENNKVVVEGYKYYFKLKVKGGYTKDFKRCVYTNKNFPQKVVITYEGDEKLAEPVLPHGNSKRPAKVNQTFFRSKPSLLTKIKEKVASDDGKLPSEIYQVLDAAARQESFNVLHQAISAPRDVKQIQNAKERHRQSKLLSQDDIYDTYQLYNETDGFITDFHLLPSMIVVCHKKGTCLLIESLGFYLSCTYISKLQK